MIEFANGVKIYHAGDTNVFGDMAIIRDLYAPDIAMIPIGDHYTMSPREAAYACNLLQAEDGHPHALRNFSGADRQAGRFAETTAGRGDRGNEAGRNAVIKEGEHLPVQSDINAAWRMGGITAGAVEDYLYSLLPARDEVLTEMEAEAAKRNIPIVGPAVGRILYQLAMMINAKTVFELGSAIGYSTIWWARAVGEGGRVIYTDGDRKKADEARGYFDRAGVTRQITLKTGDALEFLSEEKQEFDIIFNDVDKEDYPRVFKLVLPRLRKGGLFVTDNVLWSGKVAQENPSEASTKAILEFNRLLYGSQDFSPRSCRFATEWPWP